MNVNIQIQNRDAKNGDWLSRIPPVPVPAFRHKRGPQVCQIMLRNRCLSIYLLVLVPILFACIICSNAHCSQTEDNYAEEIMKNSGVDINYDELNKPENILKLLQADPGGDVLNRLNNAVLYSDYDTIESITSNKANVDMINGTLKFDMHPIALSTIIEDATSTKLLLSKGLSPNGNCDKANKIDALYCIVPLDVAICNVNLKMVRTLVNHGADTNIATLGKLIRPLRLVSSYTPVRNLLCSSFAKLISDYYIEGTPNDGRTVTDIFKEKISEKLGVYIKPHDTDAATRLLITVYLLRNGADPDKMRSFGSSPEDSFIIDTENGINSMLDNAITIQLINHTDINSCSLVTMPPFYNVVLNHHFEIAQYMLHKGFDVNFVCDRSNAIILALFDCDEMVVDWLIAHGAYTHKTPILRYSPYEYATEKKCNAQLLNKLRN